MTGFAFIGLILLFNFVYCDNQDGGKAPRIPLNDGNSIPALGLGTFLGFDENGAKEVTEGAVEVPVSLALKAGYRLFDTAQAYKNEAQVGAAIHSSNVPRDHIYVVTKLASNKQRQVVEALKESLRLMNLTYVDLYLIHNPVAFTPDEKSFDIIDYVDTWRGMEQARSEGLTKSIGISNFNVSQIERLLAHCNVKPAVLQIEVNLNLAQDRLVSFCKQHNITVMAYTPFGGLFDSSAPPPRYDDRTLVEIGRKYGKNGPQVALRYLVQRGVVPIPKSVRKEKIEENIDIFEFQMTDEEMDTLSKFNKDHRTVFPSFWQDHPYYPYERKDVPDADPFKKISP